ncbi:MAG: hypothetical protein ACXVBD_15005 [Pseudobdellovibrio sp.]
MKVTSDSGYSKNDAAEIAVTAQRIYQGFLSSENNPVSSAYLNRDFRASAYPILISFGLIGTHGDIRMALDITFGVLWIIFLVFTGLICIRYFKPGVGLGMFLLISTFSSFVSASFNGTLELPLLAFFSASLYFYLKSENLEKTEESIKFAVCISLCALFRLPETIVIVVPLYGYFIYRYRLVTPFLIIGGVVFFTYQLGHSTSVNYSGICHLILFLLLAAELRARTKAGIFYTFLVPCFFIFVWYSPFYYKIFHWIYANNFTAASAITGHRDQLNLIQFWISLWLRWGGNTLILLTVTMAAAIFYRRGSITPYLKFIVPLFLLVLMGSFTNNGDPRYYYAGLYCFFIGAGFVFESSDFKFKTALIIFISFLQLCFNLFEIQNIQTGKKKLFSVVRPVFLWATEPLAFSSVARDPSLDITTQLQTVLLNPNCQKVAFFTLYNNDSSDFYYDALALNVIANDIYPESKPVFLKLGLLDESQIIQNLSGYNCMLLGPIKENSVPSQGTVAGMALYNLIQKNDKILARFEQKTLSLQVLGNKISYYWFLKKNI